VDNILRKIFVLLPNNRSIAINDINSTQTIAELKDEIDSQTSTEWDWDEFDLLYKTDVLDDEKSIESYNIIFGEYVKIISK
jgi:hypothetical protein